MRASCMCGAVTTGIARHIESSTQKAWNKVMKVVRTFYNMRVDFEVMRRIY